jgi:methenyltetrahydrofolate cyclohydrolase
MAGDADDTATDRIGDRTVSSLLEQLADADEVIGGGALAAVSAAAGAAMISMVGRRTLGREPPSDLTERMGRIVSRSDLARGEFLALADADTDAFAGVLAALRMPQESEADRRARHEAVQGAYRRAAEVPLTVARMAVELMEHAEDVTAFGDGEAASEGYTGASTLFAALVGAVASAEVDAAALGDLASARAIWDETRSLRERADRLHAQAQTAFMLRLDPPGDGAS